MNNKSIMDKHIAMNNDVLNNFNSFLLSKKFLSKKKELENIDLSNKLTIREFKNKTHTRKYIRRLLNDTSSTLTLSSILNKHSTKIIKADPADTTILITNYIEEIDNNNIIEENLLYTNFNLENYTGEDVENKESYNALYRRDIREAKEYKFNKYKCNEKYFEIEFKILNLLGKNGDNELFGNHLREIWKDNKNTNKLDGYITYILKLIESIDYFTSLNENEKINNLNSNILSHPIKRTMNSFDEIKLIIGNLYLNLGFNEKINNKYNNTILEKYIKVLITLCSFLVILNRTEYSHRHNINNDIKKYENKLFKSLNKSIHNITVISKTDIIHNIDNIQDYNIYIVFLYLREIIDVKHYCRDENFKNLKSKITKYINMNKIFHHSNITKLNKKDMNDYFSINNLQNIYSKFISKELFFENNSSYK